MGDTLVINGVTYVSMERAMQMVREAMAKTAPEQEWLTVRQASKLAGRSLHTVYAAIKSGELDARVPNGLTKGMRVRRGDLMAWMAGKSAAHAEG